jgi:hypothetical protein
LDWLTHNTTRFLQS